MPEPTENALFLCPVRVRPAPGAQLPENWLGAAVFCFVAAPDHLSALRMAADELAKRGWLFKDLEDGQVHQQDPFMWDE